MSETGSGRELLIKVSNVIEGKSYDDVLYVCCAMLSFLMTKLPPKGRAQARLIVEQYMAERT
jgi:hypothetical protein